MMDNKSGNVGELAEDQYLVDRILSKLIVHGKVQYFIRWKGYGKDEDCWVTEEDIWPGLVEEYEKKLKKKLEKKKAKKMKSKSTPRCANVAGHGDLPKKIKSGKETGNDKKEEVTGFARGLQPEKILAAGKTISTGEAIFLMKWKNSQVPEFVPHQEVKFKCPQVLIKFYEERICWKLPSSAMRVIED